MRPASQWGRLLLACSALDLVSWPRAAAIATAVAVGGEAQQHEQGQRAHTVTYDGSIAYGATMCERFCVNQNRIDTRGALGHGVRENSLDFLMPFDTIFRQSDTFKDSTLTVVKLCQAVVRCQMCLQRCPPSAAQGLLISALSPKQIMCQAFLVDRDSNALFRCLYEHSSGIRSYCAAERRLVDSLLADPASQDQIIGDAHKLGLTCRHFKSFEKCHFVAMARHCRINATAFWRELVDATEHAMRSIVRAIAAGPGLADECRDWPKFDTAAATEAHDGRTAVISSPAGVSGVQLPRGHNAGGNDVLQASGSAPVAATAAALAAAVALAYLL